MSNEPDFGVADGHSPQLPTAFFSAREAADYLKISIDYLYVLTSKHRLEFYKPSGGSKLYFSKAQLDNYIMGGSAR